MYKTVLKELKLRLLPYLEFWEEWSSSEACFLEQEEVRILSVHIRNNFSLPLFKRLLPHSRWETEKKINHKLKHNFWLFQEWVIFKFLCELIGIGERHGSALFYDRQIHELNIPETLKLSLSSFKTPTIRQFFNTYSPEDLKRSWMYELILNFHRLKKMHDLQSSVK